jgi:hypothetical protein
MARRHEHHGDAATTSVWTALTAPDAERPAHDERLPRCPSCASALVQVVELRMAAGDDFALDVHCPECGEDDLLVVTDAQLTAWEQMAVRFRHGLGEVIATSVRERMLERVRFTEARGGLR